MARKVLSGIALLAGILVAWQFGTALSKSAAAPTSAAVAVGTPYAAGNWRYTVGRVQRVKDLQAGTLRDTAKGEYVLIGLTVENIGAANFGLSGHDFTLHDERGTTYDNAFPTAADAWAKANGYESGLLAVATGQIPPHTPTKWVLVYDVTPGVGGLVLRLTQARADVRLS